MHEIRIPYKLDPEAGDQQSNWAYRPVQIYWPHEVLQYLFDTVGIQIGDDVLSDYWKLGRENGLAWAAGSEKDAVPKIPIKLFGDDATYNKLGDKFMGFLISCPLWRPRSGRNSRWPIAAISLYGNLGYPTLQPVLREIVWSLNCAFDHPLPGTGHTFQVTELGGDWKYLRESFNMTTHWNSPSCCHFCRLPRSEFPMFPEPLPTRSTIDFIREVLCPEWTSPLILLKRFSVDIIQWCLLHNCHLGLLWTSNGGAMDYLLELGVWGNPRVALRTRLLRAYVEFSCWRKRNGIRCSQRRFTKKMLYKSVHGAS